MTGALRVWRSVTAAVLATAAPTKAFAQDAMDLYRAYRPVLGRPAPRMTVGVVSLRLTAGGHVLVPGTYNGVAG